MWLWPQKLSSDSWHCQHVGKRQLKWKWHFKRSHSSSSYHCKSMHGYLCIYKSCLFMLFLNIKLFVKMHIFLCWCNNGRYWILHFRFLNNVPLSVILVLWSFFPSHKPEHLFPISIWSLYHPYTPLSHTLIVFRDEKIKPFASSTHQLMGRGSLQKSIWSFLKLTKDSLVWSRQPVDV